LILLIEKPPQILVQTPDSRSAAQDRSDGAVGEDGPQRAMRMDLLDRRLRSSSASALIGRECNPGFVTVRVGPTIFPGAERPTVN
jgi:hypothetical protein